MNSSNIWEEFSGGYIYNVEQKSNEWKQIRIGRITGSNIGSVLGHDSFRNCDQTLLEICGIVQVNLDENIIRGNMYEPIVRKYYELISGYQIKEIGFALSNINNYIGTSPDGIVYDKNGAELDGIIEIKVPVHIDGELLRGKRHQKYIKQTYYDQMQWNMGILRKKWCDYVVASLESKLWIIIRVAFNENYFQKMVSHAATVIETKLKPLILSHNIEIVNPSI